MQPYFYPYIGYYRLFTTTDLFVIYDCVQYPRRGYVHRNRLLSKSQNLEWFNLPIIKPNYNEKIKNVKLKKNYKEIILQSMEKYEIFSQKKSDLIEKFLLIDIEPPYFIVDYLQKTFEVTLKSLGINIPIIRSSELEISEKYISQFRILEIIKKLNATHYINAPGGKDLYDTKNFLDRGIKLEFLNDYKGPKESSLQYLFTKEANQIIGLLNL